MQYVNKGTSKQIAYRRSGSGPAVLLVHGFPANSEMWRDIAPVLSSAYTVLAIDLPGSGESAFLGASLTVDEMAVCLKQVLDNENLDNAVVIGHSMGGYAAVAFADLFKDSLTGLSLVHSTAYDDDAEKKENRRKVISVIKKGGKEAFVKQMVPNLFAPGFELSHRSVVERQVNEAMKLPSESMMAFYSAMMNRENRVGILPDASFPIQWIIGRKDNALPFGKSLQQSHLSSVNFVSVYDDCGHMSMLEQPEQLVKDLKDFLAYCYKH